MRRVHRYRSRPRDQVVRDAGVHMEGAEITTLEGLGTSENPHPLQQAFIDEQAAQCGFCLSGVILSAKACLDQNPKATDADIRQALSGVLCRCFANARMLRAISKYARAKTVSA
jgi:nicotinate dehydrogenase subunit A